MKINKTILCSLNCPDTCQLIVEMENNKILGVVGDPNNPYTRGIACPFIQKYLNRVYDSYRVLHPHKREGDTYQSWIQIDLNTALKDISNILKKTLTKYPSSSILHIQGKERGGISGKINKYFFKLLGGVTTIYEDEILDFGELASRQDFGYEDNPDPRELLNSRLIIIWSHNPFLRGEHYIPLLNQAHKKGSKIILISPIYSPAVKIADGFYQPKPGTEGLIAAILCYFIIKNDWYDRAFMKNYTENGTEFISFIKGLNVEELINLCELSPSILENLARLIATQKPFSSILGEDLCLWENSLQNIRLINALHIITGQIGESGAGIFYKNITKGLNLEFFEKGAKNERKMSWQDFIEKGKNLDPPIEVAFINRSNPINSLPGSFEIMKILREIPNVIYFGTFFDDTSETATYFLPITSIFEEKNLVYSLWHKGIGLSNEIIAPKSESRSEFFYYQRLARLLDLKGFDYNLNIYFQEVLKPLFKKGITWEKISSKMVLNPYETKIPYQDKRFLTPSTKIQLITHLEFKNSEKLTEFPYLLYPIIHRDYQYAQAFPNEIEGLPVIALNGEILKNLKGGIGREFYLYSKYGEVKVRVAEDNFQRKDLILFPFGRSSLNNENVNILLPPNFYSKNGDPLYYGSYVNLRGSEK